ncbi:MULTISPECIES: septation protein SepH [Kocuria]|uniref:DUF3071 domain-containing protein n=1 Tax=Kocuria subflava TaxID=1736139 RepID=A0A846TQ33_9MICC|nr:MULTISPECIES: septation protein SepH [Kocuria]NKE08929.1 DUF3071 domain-containing protein [Kocuria subflava]
MDELRLVGVHDDGEHLVLQDATGGRFLLVLDQQLRGTVQRARRVAPRRNTNVSGDFGPREIQARFRAGATVDEIVEESGWEAARVKRYEWPILAERAHVAREAQKVEVVTSTPRNASFRSVFDGEPQTLAQTVASHAADLGVATTSLDWDAWQRPDQQWQVTVRFRLSNPAVTPQDVVDQQPAAQWIFNPAGLTVTADNQWARLLTTTPEDSRALSGSDSLFGAPRTQATTHTVAPSSTPAEPAPEQSTADVAEPVAERAPDAASASGDAQHPTTATQGASAQDTDELLEVLEARRGRRLGQDTDSDDHLAEILGRNMGHVDRHPRPISAPQDSTLFDGPAHAAQGDADQSAGSDAVSHTQTRSDEAGADQEAPTQEATIHHLGRADERTKPATPVVEITDDDARPLDTSSQADQEESSVAAKASQDTVTHLRGARKEQGAHTNQAEETSQQAHQEPTDGAEANTGDAAGQNTATESTDTVAEQQSDEFPAADADSAAQEPAARPRPRGRVNSKRSRSSVPSWDEIVFGAKTDD